MVSQLGTIANSEHEHKQPITANALIQSCIERFDQEAEAFGKIDFQTRVPDSVHVIANQENFETALIKLLINANESSLETQEAANQSITVCAHQDLIENRPKLIITVSDQGSGIDPAISERIFEPFVTNKAGVGRGMGLTIARHIMRKNDGDVQVEASSKAGTHIRLTYPTV